MLKEIWEIQLVQDIAYTLGFVGAVWVVVKVSRGSTLTVYQGDTERKSTNFMINEVKNSDGKVMKHIREESGQTWEVKTPNGETSYYTTINTEDDT